MLPVLASPVLLRAMHTKVHKQISSDHSKATLLSTQALLHKVKLIMSRVYSAESRAHAPIHAATRHLLSRPSQRHGPGFCALFTETTLLHGRKIVYHIVLLLRHVQQRFVLPALVKPELRLVRCWAL